MSVYVCVQCVYMSTLCVCTCVLCICVKYLNDHIVCIGIYVYHCVHEYFCVCIFVQCVYEYAHIVFIGICICMYI